MQERAANIEIAFPTRGKHQRGQCVDSDANNRNPNNGAGPDLSRIVETTQCFPCNCADGDKQKNRVEQRRQYRAATKPVSFAFRRKSLGHHARSPREQKAEDIAQVVTGVGDQCERMSKEPENRFEQHICRIKRNADDERSIKEVRRRVRMRVFVSHDQSMWAIILGPPVRKNRTTRKAAIARKMMFSTVV